MLLNKKQKRALVTWISEGLLSDEINRRAAMFKPPFKVTWQHVHYYRRTRRIILEDIRAADEQNALRTGYALRAIRIAGLCEAAEEMAHDLLVDNLIWLPRAKELAGRKYEYLEFNKDEIDEFRLTLKAIAIEMGDRRGTVNLPFISDQAWNKIRSSRLKEVAGMPDWDHFV